MDGMQWTPSMAEIFQSRQNAEILTQNLERFCPHPDWPCFMQTLLGPSESHDIEDNFLGARQPSSSKESDRYKFHTVKGFQREFPLKKRYTFALPLSLPDTSEQMEAHRYRGNCLDTLNMNKNTMVIYPGSECIKISIMKQSGGSQRRHHKLSDKMVCPITKPVYQIVSKLVTDNGYIVSRFKKTVDFACIKGSSEKIDSVTVNPKHKFRSTGVCLSNVLPGYFSMSYEDGSIYMYDVNSSKSLWKSNMQESESPSKTSYCCNFGNHPLSLYVNNNENVWLCDTRDKAERLVQSSQVLGSDICLLSHCEEKPYYYLVTKSCLYVFDERYNKMPIMKWQHMLLNSPSLLSKLKLDGNEIIMLSSTEDNQTCAVLNEWVQHSSSTWCRSRSFPKHFNFMDTIDYAHTQGISFNSHTMERISSPNYGLKLCIIKCQTYLLTLNKFGDVFAQRFTTSGKSDEKESSGKKILSQWQEKVMDVMKAPDTANYYKPPSYLSDMKLDDLPEFTLPEKLPTKKKKIWDLRPNEKTDSNTFWQSTIIDDYITDKESNSADRIGTYFPKEISDKHKIDKNKTYSHPLTAKLLTLWKEEPPADRGARYHSAPLLLNKLKRIPDKMKGLDSQPEVEDLCESPPSQSEKNPKDKSQPKYLPNDSQIFEPSQSFSQGSKMSKKKNKRKRVDGF